MNSFANPQSCFLGLAKLKLVAFVISATLAGMAGSAKSLVFQLATLTDVHWHMSGEVVLMTILGGMNHFWGPVVGTTAMVVLNQQITSYTEYWPLVLGTILLILLFVFPSGLVGALDSFWQRMRGNKTGGANA